MRSFIKKKDQLLSGPSHRQRKRKREGQYAELEDAMNLWIEGKNSQGALPSNSVIAAKAIKLSKLYGIEGFSAGPSWVTRFKKRKNILWKKQHCEKQSADVDGADSWLDDTLPDLLSQYSEDDIYNADETGMYWRGLPDRGYHAA